MTGDVALGLRAVCARIDAACAAAGRAGGAVALLAVSKTHPTAAVRAAYDAGQRAFGENRVQELVAKANELERLDGLQWHLIGSLQTNKVRDLLRVPSLALVQSLDRVRLADEMQRQLQPLGRTLDVLLQVNATGEESKHGCAVHAAEPLLAHVLAHCPNLRVRGVMAMGPLDGDPAPAFAAAASLRRELAQRFAMPLDVLSLGMSGDLEAAVRAGSTLVRVGTAVFGAREA